MRAIAPGKLVLTGAYAVLRGAPAVVAAVDRYAVADTARVATAPSIEVREAFGAASAPEVDVRQLMDDAGAKLGLGSSAAALVASLGARELDHGSDLADADVRRRLFDNARGAHGRAQRGGSGVDVAASVFGGILRYTVDGGDADVESLDWPDGLVLTAFFSGSSARTSDLLAGVRASRERSPREHALVEDAMAAEAARAASAFRAGADAFVESARSFGVLLAKLGALADAPIVPPSCAALGVEAAGEGAAFFPSGAGGGDVAVWLGTGAPSPRFTMRAASLGFARLALDVDRGGVRPAPAHLFSRN